MEVKNIPMEAETIDTLIGGFSIVIAFAAICIIIMLIKYKNKSLLWFVLQLLFLIGGFIFVLNVLDNKDIPSGMLSEEISLRIGFSAVLWALSMFCMIVGVWQLAMKKYNKL